MITLSVTEAGLDLGAWVQRAIAGEKIQIACGDELVALQPIHQVEDVTAEYGVSPAQLDHFVQRVHEEIEADRKAGRLREYRGDIEAAVHDSAH